MNIFLYNMEEWKIIEGYEDYKVSNLGNVWSLRTDRILKPQLCVNGYLFFTLYRKEEKPWRVNIHNLVANAFLEPPPQDGKVYEVDHIDPYQKMNNKLSNLRWSTQTNGKLFKNNDLILGVNWSTKPSLPSPCYRVVLRIVEEWKVCPTKYVKLGYSEEEAKELARQEANCDITQKMIDLGKT